MAAPAKNIVSEASRLANKESKVETEEDIFIIYHSSSLTLCNGSLSLVVNPRLLLTLLLLLLLLLLRLVVSLQLMILHTRVLGQFTVVCTLLGVMGLKEMMDRQGKFITEGQVEERVLQMESTRNELLDRLEYQAKQHQKETSGWKRKHYKSGS
jgi:hypothetical protein